MINRSIKFHVSLLATQLIAHRSLHLPGQCLKKRCREIEGDLDTYGWRISLFCSLKIKCAFTESNIGTTGSYKLL